MLSLMERNIAAIEKRLVLLAPPSVVLPRVLRRVVPDSTRHSRLVDQVQRLRGSIYVQDGAVRPHQLSSDGRHQTPEDARSWHLIMSDRAGGVSACVWYREHAHSVSPESLRVRACPLNQQGHWNQTLRSAVESELARARRDGFGYAEVGGWAVAPKSRCTAEGLLLALAAYSLGRLFGGALGLTTATVRHSSSTILRRIGGAPLEGSGATVPSYFDPAYGCEMELLRFDSRRPNPRYAPLIEALKDRLTNVTVVVPAMAAMAREPLFAA